MKLDINLFGGRGASSGSGRFKTANRQGFGEYNKNNIPVYKGRIDYTGDFSRANLKTLTDKELTKALNKQTELYRQALNENIGDQRTRNGRASKIFNTARRQQYEGGTNSILSEMERRNMPRYNIYNKKSKIQLVSSPTREIANRYLKDMQKTDKSLQKEYGWSSLPEYIMKRERNKKKRK